MQNLQQMMAQINATIIENNANFIKNNKNFANKMDAMEKRLK